MGGANGIAQVKPRRVVPVFITELAFQNVNLFTTVMSMGGELTVWRIANQ
jgi:hypothetical protein